MGLVKGWLGLKAVTFLAAAWTVLKYIAVAWLIYCIIRTIIKKTKKKK